MISFSCGKCTFNGSHCYLADPFLAGLIALVRVEFLVMMSAYETFENWVLRTASAILKLMHVNFISDKTLKQFWRFSLVGLSSTVVSYGIYAIVLRAFQITGSTFEYSYLVASVTAFVLSVLWSYAMNSAFAFKKERTFRTMIPEIVKCYMSYGITGLVVANIILYILVSMAGLSPYISFFLVLIVTVPMNFILNKFWTYKL